MIKNYLLTAWRHIANNRLFSVINIFGLSIGLSSCIFIFMYVDHELSYDKWMPNAERVVRLHTAYYSPDRPAFLTVNAPGRMMEAIRNFAPEQVDEGVRLLLQRATVTREDKVFSEVLMFADPTFFEIFDLPFLEGSPAASFNAPLNLLVTEGMAIKYFGDTNVTGKTLTMCCLQSDPIDVSITGVLKDLPDNTHLDLDFLILMDPSMFDFAPNMLNTWTSVNTYTYFKLKATGNASTLKKRIDYWLDNESPLRDRLPEGVTPSEMMHLNLMSVPDLHLYARADAGNMGDMRPLGDIRMIYTFCGIAILILVIASINFMNLSTARASKRAREVALRKVMGASRRQVAFQFLGEAITLALISLLFALVVVEAFLPVYNEAISRDLSLVITKEPLLLASLLCVTVLVGLVSGSYPAIYLSRFLPAKIMKANQSSETTGQGYIRSALVVCQFSISIGLTVCTLVIYGQTLFARSMDVGYDYEQKLILNGINAAAVRNQKESLVSELERIPGVSSVVMSSEAPSQDRENNTGFKLLNSSTDSSVNEGIILNYYTAGFGFFEAYNMKILEGRSFDKQYGSDAIVPIPQSEDRIGRASIVINESAANRLGFPTPADAIGKTLRAEVFRAGNHDLTIVGVAKDVHYRSIKFGIRPSVFFNNPDMLSVATISFSGDPAAIVSAVEKRWRDLAPSTPVRHRFLDDMIHDQYLAEEQQAKLLAVFSLLAVLIACLGLFGLAAFTAERRTREIGIRKVMGARIRDIVTLLIWQFSIPVIIANLIAWPLAWILMTNWLESFTYRLDGSYILLASLVAGISALLIAWMTVASRALRIASANPVGALRYE